MGHWTIRLTRLTWLTCLAAAPLSSQSPSSAQSASVTAPPSGAALVSAVRGVEVVVRELERSRAFLEMLGFTAQLEEQLSGSAEEQRTGIKNPRVRRLDMALGGEHLWLRQYLAPPVARPVPADSRSNDLWFQHVAIVVSDMDRVYRWLRAHGVRHVSSGPQTLPAWNANAAGIRAFYFSDPDGHTFEVIQFPQGKGDPRWQAPPRCDRSPAELCLFLGVDHTAIAVSDTDASLSYYRDRLGLRVAGESENYGTEQEHLNAVFGARLRITALRARFGTGIELLEYLAPRDGRPAPRDGRPSDLTHWQINVESSAPSGVALAATASGGRLVGRTADGRDVLVRDRDGHALAAHSAGPM